MGFRLEFTRRAEEDLARIDREDHIKLKKVRKALGKLEVNPKDPSLESHKYSDIRGPHDEQAWESYVENNTPNAYRIWWCYRPGGVLAIITIQGHP